MMKKISTQTVIFTSTYILLCIFAFAYHIVRHEGDKFSAIFIAILTMPWLLFAALIKDAIIAMIFHYEFGFIGNNIILLACVIINAVLIFAISEKINIKNKNSNSDQKNNAEK